MFKTISFIFFCLMAFDSNAYLITNFRAAEINFDLPTRIFVTGAGTHLQNQFQEAAMAKIQKYSELNPKSQIVLITSLETAVDNKKILTNWGFTILADKKAKLKAEVLLDELNKFKKIVSLDIFSHASVVSGISLESGNHLTPATKNLGSLKSHFIKDAYAFIHGCNSGFIMAPTLSALWGIPVAGSLTSTNFQKLHTDGNFYLTEEGYFPNADWSMVNDKSFSTALACKAGGCLRLKPDNHAYIGLWGEYTEGGGLPFYKFFCAQNSAQDCSRVMAKSLLGFVGTTSLSTNSTLTQYKNAVWDFLCPISAHNDLRKECVEGLENALVTKDEDYNPFAGPMIQCNFKNCDFRFECKKSSLFKFDQAGRCDLVSLSPNKASTLVREYKAYLNGFSSLAK